MSISGALSNALSGLSANARAAEVVASNISNATTEGYSPRDLSLSGRVTGGRGGVIVNGIIRHSDAVLQTDRRMVAAGHAGATVTSTALSRLAGLVGVSGEVGALDTQFSDFQAALVLAQSSPDSTARLTAVATQAQALAQRFNSMGAAVQTMRQEADSAIGRGLRDVNALLANVVDLNARIGATDGQEKAALLDLRDQAIDQIAEFVPVRVVQRARDAVALFSTSGAILLDGRAVALGFGETPTITPDMTLESGSLSAATINGLPTAGLAGGRLAALFDLRDRLLPQAQTEIDALAMDLALRFQTTETDPGRAPGDPALFTDAGQAVVPGQPITGLAQRLALNSAARPDSGAVWRIRDGLSAATPGPAGDNQRLAAMVRATESLGTSITTGATRHFSGHIADLQSLSAVRQIEAERSQSFAAAQLEGLTIRGLQGGVDTDEQMQRLLLIQQSYAANARVIETVGTLLDTLIRI